jgi:hypothetical protein
MAKVSDDGKRLFNKIAQKVIEGTGNTLREIQNNFSFESGFRGKSRVAWGITDSSLLDSGDVSNAVVKFPMSDQGKIENETEVQEWRNIPDSVKEHLAGLLDWDVNHNWLLQERVETTQEIQKELLNQVRSGLRDAGFRAKDIKSSDIGLDSNGDPVLVDWGEGFLKLESKIPNIEQSLSGFADLREELESSTFSIITAEAPQGDVDPSIKNMSIEDRQKQLRQNLQKLNPDEIRQISGKYDDVQENPFFVKGVSGHKKNLLRLGNKYGQDTIIWGENGKFQMISTTGNVGEVKYSTTDIVEVEGNENFSRIDGVKFRFDFNF